ncbi:biotin transporter BioY [Propionimicrobium sp. PCR01-08-3]|uniref:biotin transporter BioY n=1 Tax=Propionimicrobium sp. PCR01-08-3 TaxID=3052086 RepID=UPI00255D00CC|nr:biotin transporter BioY [Propionimicrobium sp. PCR01-08-3]WIY82350.1 biotin transporter BioY [Propionimicrobium sp. PCR01-08-3]
MSNQQSQPARDLALIAVFAGVTAALGAIPPIVVPISPAPITAQSLGPMLAGVILGGRRAGLSQLLFLTLVALGLPLLAGGRGGIGVFVSPTWGFLIAFVACAWFIGWATYRIGAPYSIWKGAIVLVLGGLVLMYGLGIPGMMVSGHLSFTQAVVANIPYLPGDIAKIVIALIVAKGVHAALPGMLPWGGAKAEAAAAAHDKFNADSAAAAR